MGRVVSSTMYNQPTLENFLSFFLVMCRGYHVMSYNRILCAAPLSFARLVRRCYHRRMGTARERQVYINGRPTDNS